ncbi:hypothetical protein IT418_01400 [bacterium]|nr:hypothetical protein [bacterium]
MELLSLLQRPTTKVAILAVSLLGVLSFSVGKGVAEYASLYMNGRTAVLGESVDNNFQCLSKNQFTKFLDDTKKTVTLYAPNKAVTVPLEPLLGCFASSGCTATEFSCVDGSVSLVQSCVTEYFRKYPLEVDQMKLVTGVGAVAQVHVQDWTVNYENLAEQLSKAVTDEIKYCQVEGKAEQTRQNIGSIQLVVADELPGIKGNSFTKRFMEIDRSKEKLYFWNDGVYQTLKLVHGARVPKEAIYKRESIDFRKILNSTDTEFIQQNSQESDYVVVHE